MHDKDYQFVWSAERVELERTTVSRVETNFERVTGCWALGSYQNGQNDRFIILHIYSGVFSDARVTDKYINRKLAFFIALLTFSCILHNIFIYTLYLILSVLLIFLHFNKYNNIFILCTIFLYFLSSSVKLTDLESIRVIQGANYTL